MKTSLMFVQDNEPLSGRRVRWREGQEEVSCVADDDGKIDVDLVPGTYDFEVGEDGTNQRVEIRESGARLLVIQLGKMAGPNTEDGIYAHYITKLGTRYAFDSILGRGGMGVVIKAQDSVLHRPVAIKLLNEELRHNEEAQRIFLTEARSLATLSHPNLVGVHDVATIEDNVVMISEFVEGKSLEERLVAKGSMSQSVVVRIGIQLAQALAYMHQQGMIHRDIKPANMMVQKDGNLKVIDFGLARSLEDIANKGTRLRGTPAYMAPEQLVGDPLTGSLDLYQTGVTLYELLTGKLPFQGGDISFAHVHREPDPIDTYLPEINPHLARLIMQCLAKDPKERPASAALLAQDLSLIATHLQGGATAELKSIGVQSQPMGTIPHLESAAAPPTTHNTETMDIRRDEILLHTSGPSKPKRPKALLPAMALLVLLCLIASITIVLLWEGDSTGPLPPEPSLAASAQDPLPSTPQEPLLATPKIDLPSEPLPPEPAPTPSPILQPLDPPPEPVAKKEVERAPVTPPAEPVKVRTPLKPAPKKVVERIPKPKDEVPTVQKIEPNPTKVPKEEIPQPLNTAEVPTGKQPGTAQAKPEPKEAEKPPVQVKRVIRVVKTKKEEEEEEKKREEEEKKKFMRAF